MLEYNAMQLHLHTRLVIHVTAVSVPAVSHVIICTRTFLFGRHLYRLVIPFVLLEARQSECEMHGGNVDDDDDEYYDNDYCCSLFS